MANGIKVALPGYDAFVDPDPDHFSLFVDNSVDYVLIKVKESATVSVTTTQNIAHNLGYIPFCLVFVEQTSGVWRKVFSRNVDGADPYFYVNVTNLVLKNAGGARNFLYYIFYDKIQ